MIISYFWNNVKHGVSRLTNFSSIWSQMYFANHLFSHAICYSFVTKYTTFSDIGLWNASSGESDQHMLLCGWLWVCYIFESKRDITYYKSRQIIRFQNIQIFFISFVLILLCCKSHQFIDWKILWENAINDIIDNTAFHSFALNNESWIFNVNK